MTREEFLNLGIGETFILGCRKFKVTEAKKNLLCNGCWAKGINCGYLRSEDLLPFCSKESRKDNKDIIFTEVEEK